MDLNTTYVQSRGREPFDWNAFLNKEEITESEWIDAKEASGNFVSCAVGNQCSIIPRHRDGEPLDEELSNLGLHFYQLIKGQYLLEAKETLKHIEERSVFLINQIQNESGSRQNN